jgi:hypothetical protein
MIQDSVRTKITVIETQFRAAITESMMEDFSETINWIIDHMGNPAVGTVHESVLTEAQFQSIRGTDWVLCDGRNVAGSDYHAITGSVVIPDMRGLHYRGKNNGRSDGNQNPGGDLALGTFQSDDAKAHVHTATQNDVGTTRQAHSNGGLDRDDGFLRYNADIPGFAGLVKTLSNSSPASVQQQVKQITVNYFIRIDA